MSSQKSRGFTSHVHVRPLIRKRWHWLQTRGSFLGPGEENEGEEPQAGPGSELLPPVPGLTGCLGNACLPEEACSLLKASEGCAVRSLPKSM